MGKSPDTEIVALTSDITDQELHDVTVATTRLVRNRRQGFGLAISGYEHDPRELWEIPEVQQICQRLVDIGFISVLDLGIPYSNVPGALTAFLVWKMASGDFHGRCDVTKEEGERFFEVLQECNDKCDALDATCATEPTVYAARF